MHCEGCTLKKKKLKKDYELGLSDVEHLPTMYMTLSSIPYTANKEKGKGPGCTRGSQLGINGKGDGRP